MKLKCLCCSHEQEFADPEAAYAAGWDAPPHFSVGPFCNLCPAAPFAIHGTAAARERHRPMHEKWAREGRPEEFDPAVELERDGVASEEFQKFQEWLLRTLTPEQVAALKEQLMQGLRRH